MCVCVNSAAINTVIILHMFYHHKGDHQLTHIQCQNQQFPLAVMKPEVCALLGGTQSHTGSCDTLIRMCLLYACE